VTKPKPRIVGAATELGDDEVEALERQVERVREQARRVGGLRDRQTGAIRREHARAAKRKAAKQARKSNRKKH
jgi:hypothetical protein